MKQDRKIIRAKKRGKSTNRIAQDMKLSPSSVKRVWMHWTKTKMPLIIKKFGRRKKTLDESIDTKWYLQTPDIAFWSRLPGRMQIGNVPESDGD
jgi:hypothetical protein